MIANASKIEKNTINASATGAVPSLDSLNRLTGDGIKQVNEIIIGSIAQDVKLIADIGRHIIASGGKRIRPALTIASAKLCGYDDSISENKRHVRLAAAVELIHTATLLHDDVVDESTMRRGDQTANEIWSNQASVLVGDFLLSRAFQLMTADGSLDVLRILSDASATISQGEVKQLMTAHDPDCSYEDYIDVVSSKTAALFAAATEIGAVVAGKQEYQEELRNFGNYLGIAFQLVDDALDYAASQEKLGKTIGDDFREGKITLPVILAYQDGSKEEQEFWLRTLRDMEQDTDDGKDLAYAIDVIEKHNALQRSLEYARDFAHRAAQCLHGLSVVNPEAKEALLDTLAFCVEREF